MVAITKDEAAYLRENCPNVHIVRTMKQKSKRHKYFCEEIAGVMSVLNHYRTRGADDRKKVRVGGDCHN